MRWFNLMPIGGLVAICWDLVGWWFVLVAYLWVGALIRLALLDPACGPVVTWRVLIGWAWGLVDDRGIEWTRR